MNTDPAYDGYREWKQWDRLFDPQPHESALFAKEFRGITIAGKRWLDIGFGSGALLGWARSQGATIAGIEIQPELRQAAQAQGITTFNGIETVQDASFDVITAFDVLEHIPRELIIPFLQQIRRAAASNATVVFRVPNCQSAAGLLNQFGDVTHITMLSGPILTKLCTQAGLEPATYREALDSRYRQSLLKRLLRPLQDIIKYFYKIFIRTVFSSGNTPLSANVIVSIQLNRV